MALDFRGIGVNLRITAANVADLEDQAILSAAVGQVNDRTLYADANSFAILPGRTIEINGVEFTTMGAGIQGGFGALITVTDPTGQRYKLKRVIPNADNPVVPTITEFLIHHLFYRVASAAAFPATPAALKLFYFFKGRVRGGLRPYYALMEEGGENLLDFLVANPNSEVLSYFKTIATQLNSLQQTNDFVHADLKPNNILLDRQNHLRIIDFGFSRFVQNGITLRTKDRDDYNNWRDLTHLAIGIGWFCPDAFRANRATLRSFLSREARDVFNRHNNQELYWEYLNNPALENRPALPQNVIAALAAYPLYNPAAAPTAPNPFGGAAPPPPPPPPPPPLPLVAPAGPAGAGAAAANIPDAQMEVEIRQAYREAIGDPADFPAGNTYEHAAGYVIRDLRAAGQPLRAALDARLNGIRTSANPTSSLYFDACGFLVVELFSIRGATPEQQAALHRALFDTIEPSITNPLTVNSARVLTARMAFLQAVFNRMTQAERTTLLAAADKQAQLQALEEQGRRGVRERPLGRVRRGRGEEAEAGRHGRGLGQGVRGAIEAGTLLGEELVRRLPLTFEQQQAMQAVGGCCLLFACCGIFLGGSFCAIGTGFACAIGLAGRVVNGAVYAAGGGIQVVGEALRAGGRAVEGSAGRRLRVIGEGVAGFGEGLRGVGGGKKTRKRSSKRKNQKGTRSGWKGRGGRTLVASSPLLLNAPFEIQTNLKSAVKQAPVEPEPDIHFDYDLPSEYSRDFFKETSAEYLLDSLRFDTFASESPEVVKEILVDLFYLPCRNPEILDKILSFARSKDSQGLRSFARKQREMFPELQDLFLDAFDVDIEIVQVKDPKEIIAAYLREPNRRLSLRLLQVLLMLDVSSNPKALSTYIADYEALSPSLRFEKLGAYSYDAFPI